MSKYLPLTIDICRNSTEINTHSLQRKLSVGYSTALRQYKKLKELKIIMKEKYINHKFENLHLGRVKVGIIDAVQLAKYGATKNK